LDKSCLAKTQKSGFFGVRILSEPLYIKVLEPRFNTVIINLMNQVEITYKSVQVNIDQNQV